MLNNAFYFIKYGIGDVQTKDSTQKSSHQYFSIKGLSISSAIKTGKNNILILEIPLM